MKSPEENNVAEDFSPPFTPSSYGDLKVAATPDENVSGDCFEIDPEINSGQASRNDFQLFIIAFLAQGGIFMFKIIIIELEN
ncbi:MAG: hypothetical protein ACRENZ_07965 [Thermodesulfobacteriota bacterium]